MRASARLLGALETSVGLRTFVLFGVCAPVPIALFAAWSYRIVSSELAEAAVARLGESSKRYGLLINERLRIVEALLADRTGNSTLNGGCFSSLGTVSRNGSSPPTSRKASHCIRCMRFRRRCRTLPGLR